jgi:hypothetical protein
MNMSSWMLGRRSRKVDYGGSAVGDMVVMMAIS